MTLKERIRGLENQNEDLRRNLIAERKKNAEIEGAAREIQQASDALLIAMAQRYGEEVLDDGDDAVLGWRLSIERPRVEALKEHSISVRVDEETGRMVIGIIREEATGDA